MMVDCGLDEPAFFENVVEMKKTCSDLSDAIAAAKRQDFAELEEMALKILKNTPDEAEAHNLLGVAYASTGRIELALKSMREAHRLAPQAYSYSRNLVRMLSNQRQFSEATSVARSFADAKHPKADELVDFAARTTGQVVAEASEGFRRNLP